MDFLKDRRVLSVLAAIVVLLGGGAVVVTVDGGGEGGVRVAPVTPTPTATSSPADEVAPAGRAPGDVGEDLRSEPAVPGKAEDAAKTNAAGRKLEPRSPPAGGRVGPDCRTDFSGRVWSDRAPGTRVTEFVLHYTVSRNVPGWADVLAIRDYFERTRLGSAHYIVDFEGHCLKMVPLKRKAWTQGNANSWADSVEIIATGAETREQWRASPLIRKGILAGLARRVMDYRGLPLRRVDPVGCVFVPGVTDHLRLECGNNHTDVGRSFPWKRWLRQLRAAR